MAQPRRPIWKTALLATLAVVLTVCSKNADQSQRQAGAGEGTPNPSTTTAETARPGNPCALLTSADTKEILGEDIINTETAPSDDPAFSRCTFDTSAFAGRILLTTNRYGSEDEARSSVKAEAAAAEPTTGIGDEGYLSAVGGEFHLDCRKGVVVIRLALITDDPAGGDKIKALALKVLGRL